MTPIPTNTESLLELAAKVEAASGPDRELDAAIGLATGWECRAPTAFYMPHWHRDGRSPSEVIAGPRQDGVCPFFTASLDAAMTLVPEGWDWSLCRYAQVDEGFLPFSVNMTPEVQPYPVDQEIDVEAVTAALALCAAALRARAAQGGDS